MKAAGFQSAKEILVCIRSFHRKHWSWGVDLQREYADAKLSVLRGICLSRRQSGYDVRYLVRSVVNSEPPVTVDGPIWPLNAVVMQTFWCLREIEVPDLMLSCLSVNVLARAACVSALGQL